MACFPDSIHVSISIYILELEKKCKYTYTCDVDTESIAEALNRSSGAKSKTVAKDVTMVPLRKLIATGASTTEMEQSEGMVVASWPAF